MTLAAVDGSARTAVHVADAVEYSLLLTSCALLIAYLRRNRHSALRGDAGAARKLILPAFEPLLWSLSAAMLFLLSLALASLLASDGPSVSTLQLVLMSEAEHAGRQFAQLLVPVFLLHKSVSLPALRRSALLTLVLAGYSLPIAWTLQLAGSSSDQWLLPLARAGVFAFYLYLTLKPPARASKRSLREYCAFAAVYHALLLVSSVVFLYGANSGTAGSALVFATVAWSALLPLAVWRVLKADTEHWRGLGQRACALQRDLRMRLARQPKSNGAGNALDLHERISSQGLHVLIEMHRKFIIDFAYLEIRERIGAGASAAVFRGVLRSRLDVAVKVYTPADFTDETVAAFSHEAALCGSLRHPNVVRFLGMCILPPTICLVSELCQGSLDDVMRSLATSSAKKKARRRRRSKAENPEADASAREMLVELAYMLDAARAVAYLHSFSPPFLHRDIKPSNFLVDVRHCVKLTDFGESRSLPREHQYQHSSGGGGVGNSNSSSSNAIEASGGNTSDGTVSASLATVTSTNHRGEHDGSRCMTVRGTVDYMAPELISGRAGTALYAEAADVYALGMTLWDILYPMWDKYPELKGSHLAIFEAVLHGQRPKFDDQSAAQVPTALRQLIERTWEGDARSRPTASQVVAALEHIQEQALAEFALRSLVSPDAGGAHTAGTDTNSISEGQFWTGEALAKLLESTGAARRAGEAVRLGNALMDAGLLHHWRHSAGFEPTAQHSYLVDEGSARLFQAIGPSDPCSNSSSASSLAVATGSRHNADDEKKQEGSDSDSGGDASDDAEIVVAGKAARSVDGKKAAERHRFYPTRHRHNRRRRRGIESRDATDRPHRHRYRHGIDDLVDLLGRVHLRTDNDQQLLPSPCRHARAASTTAMAMADVYHLHLDQPQCACRRLGQRLERRQGDAETGHAAGRKHQRHLRGRFGRVTTKEAGRDAIAVMGDEHALTAELLAREAPHGHDESDGDEDDEDDEEDGEDALLEAGSTRRTPLVDDFDVFGPAEIV